METLRETEAARCMKCGRDIKHSEDRIAVDGHALMCSLCYREMMYPLLKTVDMELFGRGTGPLH